MTCPYHDGSKGASSEGDEPGDEDETRANDDRRSAGVDRRSFLRSALTIGGASALSSVVSSFGWPETGRGQARAAGRDRDDDAGVSVAERRNRQHAWDAYSARARGTAQAPEHHLLLLVDYESDEEPTSADRRQAADAFDRLEETFEWSNEGLLFTVSYSTSYFDRFDADLPVGLQPNNGTPIPRMLTAQQIIDGWTVPNPFDRTEDGEPTLFDLQVTLEGEDPVADDDYDAVLHLASDRVQHLLAAEQLLWGEDPEAVGAPAGPGLEGVFTRPESYPDRRTGFIGNENLEENVDDVGEEGSQARAEFEESVEAGAELSFGYNDIYRNSNPREDNVTLLEDQRFLPKNPQPPGAFANGSILHVSKLDSDLEGWYGENSDADRRHRMFSPNHEKEDVGEVGENLGSSSAPDDTTDMAMRDFSDVTSRDVAERTQEDVEEGRFVGHAQKVARARAQLEAHFQPEGDRSLSETGVPLQDDEVTQEREDDLNNHDDTNQQVEAGFLRRDFNTVDDGRPGTHFVALQAFSIYLVYMRHAMNFLEWDTGVIGQPRSEDTPEDAPAPGFVHEGTVETDRSGILEYIETKRRGNFIMPPLTLRALPPARALRPEMTVTADDGELRVDLGDEALGGALDPDTVRFGYYRDINAGGGAALETVDPSGDSTTLVFDSEAVVLDRESAEIPTRVRLFGKRDADRQPVFATAEVDPEELGEQALAARFDDGDDEVDFDEVTDVIAAHNGNGNGDVSFETVTDVIAAYNDDESWDEVGGSPS